MFMIHATKGRNWQQQPKQDCRLACAIPMANMNHRPINPKNEDTKFPT